MLHITDENNKRYFIDPQSECVRLMGLNIGTSFCTDSKDDSIYHSRFRNNYLKQLVDSQNLDLCALVEVSPSQGLFIQQNFTKYELICYFSETQNDLTKTLNLIDSDKDHIKGVGEGIGVLVDKRFKVLDRCVIQLPKGKRHSRIALALTIQMNFTKLTIICTHLDHLSRESRVESLAKLGDYVKTLQNPFVVYGDFNLFPDDQGENDYLEFLQQNRYYFCDATMKNHYGSFGTFCSFKNNQFAPAIKYDDNQKRHLIPQSNRLDLMFTSLNINVHFTHCPIRVFDPTKFLLLKPTDENFDENFEKRHFISDHWPIICQFDFRLSKI